MASTTILVVGSCNMDLIAYADKLPEAGETIIGTSFQTGTGGKGANQAVVAAKISGVPGQVAICGAVGSDGFGREFRDAFEKAGVNTSALATVEGSTGVAPIWVDGKGENSIIVVPGANAMVKPEAAAAAVAQLQPAAVLCQLEVPLAASEAALRAARAQGALAMLTPAPAPAEGLPASLLAATSVLVPNKGESLKLAAALGGGACDDVEKSARALLAAGCGAVVVTCGGEGCTVVATDAGAGEGSANVAVRQIPAVRVSNVVDTTGAGDAFAGSMAFFYGLLRTRQGATGTDLSVPLLLEAVSRATYVAAFSVTRKGTQSSYPARTEVPSVLFDSDALDGSALRAAVAERPL